MARIKMKTRAAGPDGQMKPGHEYDVPDKLAAELCAAQCAEPVATGRVPESSAAEPETEKAVKPAAKKAGK